MRNQLYNFFYQADYFYLISRTVMREVPVLVAERTDLSIFEPSGDAMKMESMIALAPTEDTISFYSIS